MDQTSFVCDTLWLYCKLFDDCCVIQKNLIHKFVHIFTTTYKTSYKTTHCFDRKYFRDTVETVTAVNEFVSSTSHFGNNQYKYSNNCRAVQYY